MPVKNVAFQTTAGRRQCWRTVSVEARPYGFRHAFKLPFNGLGGNVSLDAGLMRVVNQQEHASLITIPGRIVL